MIGGWFIDITEHVIIATHLDLLIQLIGPVEPLVADTYMFNISVFNALNPTTAPIENIRTTFPSARLLRHDLVELSAADVAIMRMSR